MFSVDCWTILEIEPCKDTRRIKQAYARLLKQNRPEDDALAFACLRDAYEAALAFAGTGAPWVAPPATERMPPPETERLDPDPVPRPELHRMLQPGASRYRPIPTPHPLLAGGRAHWRRQQLTALYYAAFDIDMPRETLIALAQRYGWLDAARNNNDLPFDWLRRAAARTAFHLAQQATGKMRRMLSNSGEYGATVQFEALTLDPFWDRLDYRPVLEFQLWRLLAQVSPFPEKLALATLHWAGLSAEATVSRLDEPVEIDQIRRRLAVQEKNRAFHRLAESPKDRSDRALARWLICSGKDSVGLILLRQSLPFRRLLIQTWQDLLAEYPDAMAVHPLEHLANWHSNLPGVELSRRQLEYVLLLVAVSCAIPAVVLGMHPRPGSSSALPFLLVPAVYAIILISMAFSLFFVQFPVYSWEIIRKSDYSRFKKRYFLTVVSMLTVLAVFYAWIQGANWALHRDEAGRDEAPAATRLDSPPQHPPVGYGLVRQPSRTSPATGRSSPR